MTDSTLKKIDKYAFSLKDTLGKGSFGKVFKGKNEQNGELVAIKMIDKRLIQSDDYLMQGLMQEIQVMKKLKSPYVVQLYDVMETTNNYYIIQECCDGGDFRGYIKNHKKLSEKEALGVLKDLLSGFLELLEHGIIHRDLKPENILINKGKYKLADFGFAKTVDNYNKQLLTSLVGTPLYMAPQILMHEAYTTKSDIWSIALIYYEMIFGQTPWLARSQYELVTNIQKNPIKYDPNIPISDESKDFIERALKIQESERIGWNDIYKLPLFQGFFDKSAKSEQLENKAQFIINQLRLTVNSSKMDLEQLFEKFGLNQNSKMDYKTFQNIIEQIDSKISHEQVDYLFNKFDADGDQHVDFNEFTKWMEEHNVTLSWEKKQAENQNRNKTHTVTGGSPDQKLSRQMTKTSDAKAQKAIEKLTYAIIKYNISIAKLFNKFDKSHTKELNLKEFSDLLVRIDKQLQQDDIDLAFQKFDSDGNGSISIEEFKNTLTVCVAQYKQEQEQILIQQQMQQMNLQQQDHHHHHDHSNSPVYQQHSNQYQQQLYQPQQQLYVDQQYIQQQQYQQQQYMQNNPSYHQHNQPQQYMPQLNLQQQQGMNMQIQNNPQMNLQYQQQYNQSGSGHHHHHHHHQQQ